MENALKERDSKGSKAAESLVSLCLPSSISTSSEFSVYSQRKAQVCTRCMSVMYPHGKGSKANHKRDYCSDGARSAVTPTIPFPQPPGIFIKGKEFDLITFLLAVQNMYQRTVIEGVARDDLGVEVEAFANMFMDRVVTDTDDGTPAFRLFEELSLRFPETYGDHLFTKNGCSYLRVRCL